MVGHPHDVKKVVLGGDGALAGCRQGALLVDMTTSQPTLAETIARKAAARGVTSIDAPVSGGDIGARNGTLSIMIGGDAEAIDALEPCWQAMGSKWIRQGGPGAGQHTKMVNQTLVAAGMVGICEALLYAHRAGLDLDRALESVASGAAGSWALSNLAPRIIRGDYAPGFFVEHFLKDLAIVLDESRRMNLALPGAALAEQLYRAAAAQGHARDGTQSLILALAKLSGFAWER
jgi:3-hydroxyisobutyrate dehydrogenase